MRIITVPDFPGDGAVHSLANLLGVPSNTLARAVLLREISGGAASSRIGDQTVSATRGLPFNANDDLILPQASAIYGESPMWNLSDIYIFAATNDILAIAYVP